MSIEIKSELLFQRAKIFLRIPISFENNSLVLNETILCKRKFVFSVGEFPYELSANLLYKLSTIETIVEYREAIRKNMQHLDKHCVATDSLIKFIWDKRKIFSELWNTSLEKIVIPKKEKKPKKRTIHLNIPSEGIIKIKRKKY